MTPQPVLLTAPAVLPVSLAEFKAHCRYFESDEDAIMVSYLRAATEMVEQYTGLGLITQSWQQAFPAFPVRSTQFLTLHRRPVQEVTSISYLDGSGASQALGTTIYSVNGLGADRWPSYIRLSNGQAWPTVLSAGEAVTVAYQVGFGDDWNAVPELIRLAIKMAAGTWFGFREDIAMGSKVSDLPWSSKVLLRDWRPVAIA